MIEYSAPSYDADPTPNEYLRAGIGISAVAAAIALLVPSSLNPFVNSIRHRGLQPDDKQVVVCATAPETPTVRIVVPQSETSELVAEGVITLDLTRCPE